MRDAGKSGDVVRRHALSRTCCGIACHAVNLVCVASRNTLPGARKCYGNLTANANGQVVFDSTTFLYEKQMAGPAKASIGPVYGTLEAQIGASNMPEICIRSQKRNNVPLCCWAARRGHMMVGLGGEFGALNW
ncbi:MAG: hypothetical protein AAF552_13825, partial [Pseudomonadota bacterium]